MPNALRRLAVFTVLLALPTATWAFANGIEVRTESPEVRVLVDGQYRGQTATIFGMHVLLVEDLTPGNHRLRCEFKGFEPYETTLTVPEQEVLVHQVAFKSTKVVKEETGTTAGDIVTSTGIVRVRSKPSKAYVTLDGGEKGTADLVYKNVPVGSHTIVVFFDSSDPRQRLSVELELSRDDDITVIADFFKHTISHDAKHSVTIASEPASEAAVDGRSVGETPATLSLENGVHRVVLRRSGFIPYDEDIRIDSNKFLNVRLEPVPRFAFVEISRDDSVGAEEVSINGRQLGSTPLSVERVQAGANSISIRGTARTYDLSENHLYRIVPHNRLPLLRMAKAVTELPVCYHPPAKPGLLPELRSQRVLYEREYRSGPGLLGALLGMGVGSGVFIGLLRGEEGFPLLAIPGIAVTTYAGARIVGTRIGSRDVGAMSTC